MPALPPSCARALRLLVLVPLCALAVLILDAHALLAQEYGAISGYVTAAPGLHVRAFSIVLCTPDDLECYSPYGAEFRRLGKYVMPDVPPGETALSVHAGSLGPQPNAHPFGGGTRQPRRATLGDPSHVPPCRAGGAVKVSQPRSLRVLSSRPVLQYPAILARAANGKYAP